MCATELTKPLKPNRITQTNVPIIYNTNSINQVLISDSPYIKTHADFLALEVPEFSLKKLCFID